MVSLQIKDVRMLADMNYLTGIGDTPNRAGGDDDHARLGLYQLFAEEMRQVMLGCRQGQHLLPDLIEAR